MSAVSGTRRAIKELVDGTVRVQVDIDPRFRKRFFELFPDIDMPVALAPLDPSMAGIAVENVPPEYNNDSERLKGGPLARLAGQLCADERFRRWLWPRVAPELGPNLSIDFPDPRTFDEEAAAEAMRLICGVDSRAELDHNPNAAHTFHHKIRLPWIEEGGR